MFKRLLVLFLAVLPLLSGCKKGGEMVQSLAFTKTYQSQKGTKTVYVIKNTNKQLSEILTFAPLSANPKFALRFDDPSIASYDPEFGIRGLKEGRTNVTLSTGDGSGLSLNFLLIVTSQESSVKSITVNVEDEMLEMTIGDEPRTINLNVEGGANSILFWTHDDDDNAIIKIETLDNGHSAKITPVGAGQLTISVVSAIDPSISAQIYVTVHLQPIEATAIKLLVDNMQEQKEITIEQGEDIGILTLFTVDKDKEALLETRYALLSDVIFEFKDDENGTEYKATSEAVKIEHETWAPSYAQIITGKTANKNTTLRVTYAPNKERNEEITAEVKIKVVAKKAVSKIEFDTTHLNGKIKDGEDGNKYVELTLGDTCDLVVKVLGIDNKELTGKKITYTQPKTFTSDKKDNDGVAMEYDVPMLFFWPDYDNKDRGEIKASSFSLLSVKEDDTTTDGDGDGDGKTEGNPTTDQAEIDARAQAQYRTNKITVYAGGYDSWYISQYNKDYANEQFASEEDKKEFEASVVHLTGTTKVIASCEGKTTELTVKVVAKEEEKTK